MMDQKYKICLSNIAFSTISMSIFLFCRHKIITTNAFNKKISSLCFNLLHYQNNNHVINNSFYIKRLMMYLAIQSSFLLIQNNFPNMFHTSYKGYRIETVKLASPIIFCSVFNLPILGGVSLGILANHISSNQMHKIKQMLI